MQGLFMKRNMSIQRYCRAARESARRRGTCCLESCMLHVVVAERCQDCAAVVWLLAQRLALHALPQEAAE